MDSFGEAISSSKSFESVISRLESLKLSVKSLFELDIAIVSSIALSDELVKSVIQSPESLALTALKDKNIITIKARIEGNFILFVISPPFKFLWFIFYCTYYIKLSK